MTTGTKPAARLKLHPAFRDALRAAIRDGRPSWALAQVGGWPHQSHFSQQLHSRRVRGTPLVVKRFATLASALQYDGPLFACEPEVEP